MGKLLETQMKNEECVRSVDWYSTSDYGESKLAGEELIIRYGRENDVKVIVQPFPKSDGV